MAWQDDYIRGSADYPATEDDAPELDPWADPAYTRTEDAE